MIQLDHKSSQSLKNANLILPNSLQGEYLHPATHNGPPDTVRINDGHDDSHDPHDPQPARPPPALDSAPSLHEFDSDSPLSSPPSESDKPDAPTKTASPPDAAQQPQQPSDAQRRDATLVASPGDAQDRDPKAQQPPASSPASTSDPKPPSTAQSAAKSPQQRSIPSRSPTAAPQHDVDPLHVQKRAAMVLSLNAELLEVCMALAVRGLTSSFEYAQYSNRLQSNLHWMAAAADKSQMHAPPSLPMMEPPPPVPFHTMDRITNFYAQMPSLFAVEIANAQRAKSASLKRERPADDGDAGGSQHKRHDSGETKTAAALNIPSVSLSPPSPLPQQAALRAMPPPAHPASMPPVPAQAQALGQIDLLQAQARERERERMLQQRAAMAQQQQQAQARASLPPPSQLLQKVPESPVPAPPNGIVMGVNPMNPMMGMGAMNPGAQQQQPQPPQMGIGGMGAPGAMGGMGGAGGMNPMMNMSAQQLNPQQQQSLQTALSNPGHPMVAYCLQNIPNFLALPPVIQFARLQQVQAMMQKSQLDQQRAMQMQAMQMQQQGLAGAQQQQFRTSPTNALSPPHAPPPLQDAQTGALVGAQAQAHAALNGQQRQLMMMQAQMGFAGGSRNAAGAMRAATVPGIQGQPQSPMMQHQQQQQQQQRLRSSSAASNPIGSPVVSNAGPAPAPHRQTSQDYQLALLEQQARQQHQQQQHGDNGGWAQQQQQQQQQAQQQQQQAQHQHQQQQNWPGHSAGMGSISPAQVLAANPNGVAGGGVAGDANGGGSDMGMGSIDPSQLYMNAGGGGWQ